MQDRSKVGQSKKEEGERNKDRKVGDPAKPGIMLVTLRQG